MLVPLLPMLRNPSRRSSTRPSPSRNIGLLQLEALEDRLVPTAAFRSITGLGNNLAHPDWGAAQTQLLRLTTVGYGDAISTPGGADRPGARAISNAIAAQGTLDLPSQRLLSSFVFLWGQFLDHDLDLTGGAAPAQPFNIPVPAGDPRLDPESTGTQFIGFRRSRFDASTGTSVENPRQQLNSITSFMDGSMIYGSEDARALALRTGTGGRLKTSAGDLLPFNTFGLSNANAAGLPADQLFVAGDIRVNENIALTAIHTLFVREHNYWADEIARLHPGLEDEELYQRARQRVIAEIQAITYNEFLPAVMGPGALAPYTGYQAEVNPAVSTEFSTAGYRVGHTMLPGTLLRLDASGQPLPEGNVPLRDAFFTPWRITNEGGIEPILRGIAAQIQQEVDAKIVDDVRDFLQDSAPVLAAVDLAAINIQRGRDHGLPGYNQARIDFGLAPVAGFADITADIAVQTALENIYVTVDQIDVWVGGICEDHLPGSSLGALFTAIWRDQFERTRDGDRYWYQSIFSGKQLADIENTTLADIIRRNTDITDLQDNIFFEQSVMHYQAPRGQGPADLLLRRMGSNLRLIDQRTGQVVRSQALADMHSVIIVGNDFQGDRLTVDFGTGGALALPGGLVFDGGQAGGDIYRVLGTVGNDAFAALGAQVSLGDFQADLSRVETITMVGQLGKDTYQLGLTNIQVNIVDSVGQDTLDCSAFASGVTVDLNLSAGQSQMMGGGVSLRIIGQLENLIGSAFDDVLIGNDAVNQIAGGAGHDFLDGRGGSDCLDGADGNDTLLGGGGHDLLLGGTGDDRLIGNQGRDLLFGGEGSEEMMGGIGADILICGATSHDGDLTALFGLRNEWTSNRTYELRVANLHDGSGSPGPANGNHFLTAAGSNPTVFDDAVFDLLQGGMHRDWLMFTVGDLAPDRGPFEQVN